MPLVILEPALSAEPAPRGESRIVQAPDGGSLADLCDESRALVPFSCRDANCGACGVEVLEGPSELLPAEAEERAGLERCGLVPEGEAAPRVRLACRAAMRAGLGVLRLRPRRAPPAGDDT